MSDLFVQVPPDSTGKQIARLDETTADIQLKYANGTAGYTLVWNSRAGYTY